MWTVKNIAWMSFLYISLINLFSDMWGGVVLFITEVIIFYLFLELLFPYTEIKKFHYLKSIGDNPQKIIRKLGLLQKKKSVFKRIFYIFKRIFYRRTPATI
ncbi:TPA: hypothetical protein DEP21_04465 [Patescibacteria group bacterium]|nr:hypothetical protein [Candidatus Gracilibacteria bacterium]